MTDWLPIDTAPEGGTWILIRGRNSADYPMIPVVCAWRSCAWRDSASLKDMTNLVADVPIGSSADWAPLPDASADTHPKDGDVEQAPLVSGAVAKPDARTGWGNTPAELIDLVLGRIGQDFDGECHLTEAEARNVADQLTVLTAALERIGKRKMGGPFKGGQVVGERREMIAIARAALTREQG